MKALKTLIATAIATLAAGTALADITIGSSLPLSGRTLGPAVFPRQDTMSFGQLIE